MYLGLDLRGGVHFLLAVDMKAAVTKRIEAATGEVRTLLRDHKIRHAGIVRVGDTLEISFRNEQDLEAAMDVLRNRQTDLTFAKRRSERQVHDPCHDVSKGDERCSVLRFEAERGNSA